MNKPRIIDESTGEEIDEAASYCPKCGSTHIEKNGPMSKADFDESGWFHRQGYICKNTKCGHTWGNKIVTVPGGYRIR
jgi:transposase-like protein